MRHSFIILSLFSLLLFISCGTNRSFSNAPYSNASNNSQSAVGSRGVKLEVEECEEMAADVTAENPRTFGNGVSSSESFATDLAILNARTRMAQRIASTVKGLIINASGQTQNEDSYQAMSGRLETESWDQYVTNTRVIKKNTYIKENGQYNVYVCIEMPKEQLKNIYNHLSEDKTISAKITESMFMEGFKMVEVQ